MSLLDRSGGRIALTPADQALLPYAEKLRAASEDAHAAVVSASGKLGGQLALGVSQTIGQYALPNLAAVLLREKRTLAWQSSLEEAIYQ